MRFRELFFAFLFLTVGTIFARQLWESKSYLEWTQKEAVSVLNDSPWAQNQIIRGQPKNFPVADQTYREGSCTETDMASMQEGADAAVVRTAASASALAGVTRTYSVRFLSAVPVRKAIARWALLNGRISLPQAEAMVERNNYPNHVVVSVSASNEQDWSELNSFTTEDLGESNFLFLKKSEARLLAEKYVLPAESGIGEALFYFPRHRDGKAIFIPSEKQVTFSCRLSGRTEFRKHFELKKMVVEGKLVI